MTQRELPIHFTKEVIKETSPYKLIDYLFLEGDDGGPCMIIEDTTTNKVFTVEMYELEDVDHDDRELPFVEILDDEHDFPTFSESEQEAIEKVVNVWWDYILEETGHRDIYEATLNNTDPDTIDWEA